MKGLIAQAYQMSLGKTEKEAKENRNAMKELTDAMRNGLVKPDKIFPILVDLMKQASAEGTEAARKSPSAQEDRFWNRMEKGWENFTKGGGASGIANFWNDLTGSVGAWFEENGAWLGKQFEILIQRFKVFRIGLTDLFKYLWDGENTGFVTWLAQEKGIDLSGVRVFFRELWATAKDVGLNLAKTVGLIDKDGNFDFKTFGERIKAFIKGVGEALGHLKDMFLYLSHSFSQIGQILQGGPTSIAKIFIPFTKEAGLFGAAITNLGYAAGSFGQATGSALGAITAPIIPQTEDTSKPLPYKLSSMVVGDGKSGMSLRQHKLAYPELYPPSAHGAEMRIPTTFSSGAPIPRKILPQDDIPKLGTDMYTPTAVDALPVSSAAQGAQSFGLNTQKIAPLDVNVNVKMEVSGDPEQMKLYAAEEVAKGIANRVPKLLDESFDYKFSGKLKSVITDAPLN